MVQRPTASTMAQRAGRSGRVVLRVLCVVGAASALWLGMRSLRTHNSRATTSKAEPSTLSTARQADGTRIPPPSDKSGQRTEAMVLVPVSARSVPLPDRTPAVPPPKPPPSPRTNAPPPPPAPPPRPLFDERVLAIQ